MIAKDLIRKLQDVHPDCPVCYDDDDYQYGIGCREMVLIKCEDTDCEQAHPHMVVKAK